MPNESGTWIMYGVSWEDPEKSAEKIAEHMRDIYPVVTSRQISHVIGVKAGERKMPEQKMK